MFILCDISLTSLWINSHFLISEPAQLCSHSNVKHIEGKTCMNLTAQELSRQLGALNKNQVQYIIYDFLDLFELYYFYC